MTTLLHPDYSILNLPDSLIDFDVYKRNPYRQNETIGLTGSLSLFTAKILAGMRLELRGGDNFGFITGAILETLKLFAYTRKTMVLTYQGTVFNVVFDYGNSEPILADKVQLKSTNVNTDYYNNVSIKFILV